MSERTGPVYSASDYAGFVLRTLALVIDISIFAGGYFVLYVVLYLVAPEEWVEHAASRWLDAIFWSGFVVYMLGLRMTSGGTIGYRVMGIRYAYVFDEKPGMGAIMFRSFVAVVLLLVFALDHIWILFDDRKQAWHDKVSGFYVVKKGAQPRGTQRVAQRVINFMMLTFVVWEPVMEQKDA